MDRLSIHAQEHPLRLVFISSFVPRECGIATYADDVMHAVSAQGVAAQVTAMERPGEHFTYDDRVIGAIEEDAPEQYLRAAAQINDGPFDAVSFQHEFGIYGGEHSDVAVRFIEAITKPVVVTFHTVVENPSPEMRTVQRALAERADAIVVMNGLAPALLEQIYGADPAKIHIIHHGAPVPHQGRGRTAKRVLELDGREIISSFGLLSPTKGLDDMIRAMPRIIAERPDAYYYILGQTHPAIVKTEGEKYRGMLENLAYELGVLDHIYFIDRYLTKKEIVSYLLATDTYVTPYLNMEQVTSGTLAYALGSGCPVVSTPYLHARYLLDGGRGLLVPPHDPAALAQATLRILQDEELHRHMQRTNWEFGKQLYWPQVGQEYAQVFRQAVGQ